jgi:hypothetical protein
MKKCNWGQTGAGCFQLKACSAGIILQKHVYNGAIKAIQKGNPDAKR